jgi:hypothetical protein
MLMGENNNAAMDGDNKANAAPSNGVVLHGGSGQLAPPNSSASDTAWRNIPSSPIERSAKQQLHFSQSEQQPSSNRTSFSVTPSLNLALGDEWSTRYPGDLMTTFGGFKSASVTPRLNQ